MAFNFLIGLYVNTSATNVNSISGPTWSDMQPTYWTYSGNTTNRTFGGTGFTRIDTLYTNVSRGENKYVLYLVDADTAGINFGDFTTMWFHNDTLTYAHPDSPDVNVNNGKYVWVYDNEAPLSYNYNGLALPVFTFDCRFNMWQRSPNTLWDREFRSKFMAAVATLDYPDNGTGYGFFDGPGNRYGTSIVELYDTAPASSTKLLVVNSTSISTSSNGVYNQYYIYDHVSSSYTTSSSPAQTSVTYPHRVYVIHDGAGLSSRYHVGYIGNSNSSAVTVYHQNETRETNLWVPLRSVYNSNYLYLATTVSTTGQFIEYVLPVQLGRQYTFMARSRAATNNGIIISKTQINNPSGTAAISNIGTSSDRIAFTSDTTTVSNAIYKPTADGNVYVYYRTKSSGTLGDTNYPGCAMGSVEINDTELDFINVTFNKNGGSGGTNSQLIRPGTEAGNYPSITLPTRSGYIFQGYYDNETNGNLYYNSAGQGVRVFDKVENCYLYAHWQLEPVETVIVTLNQNGGSGGQSQVAIPKNATTSQYPTIQLPTRTGLSSSSPAFSFLGYWDGVDQTSSTQYIGENGQGLRTFNKTSACTFYAGWKNNIYVDFLDSVTVEFSPDSQSVKIANSTICSSGESPVSATGGLVPSGVSCTFTDGGKYVTIPASTPVGTYTVSYHLNSPSNATAADGYHGYNKLFQGCELKIIKATPTFDLQGQTVSQGNTAQAKVRTSVPGTVYWGTSSSAMTNTMSISASQVATFVDLTNATNSTAGQTVTIYAYFVPTNTASYNNSSTKSAELTVTIVQTVTITLDDNGGSGGSGSITVEKNTYGNTGAWPTVLVPTRTGFIFMGYYDTSSVTGGTQWFTTVGTGVNVSSGTTDCTVYARWKVRIDYDHNHKTSGTAIVGFVSNQPGEATSTSSAVTMQIDGVVTCVVSSRTFAVTTSGKTSWSINSTGTQLTIPSGVSYTSGFIEWTVTVANGTYNGYPYIGNSMNSYNSGNLRYLYYNLKKVEYEKEASYPYTIFKYKDMNGTLGYNVSSTGMPGDDYGPYGPYYYAYENETYVRCKVSNSITWYQKYTNGTWDTTVKSGDLSVNAYWMIISETFTPADGSAVQNITRSTPLPGTNTKQLIVDGQNRTVYEADGDNFLHESMMKQLGKDTVVVRIYNPDDTTKYLDVTKDVTNSLPSTKYTTSECTTYGYASLTPSNPTVTIGDSLTAGGSSGTITCVCNDTASWYQKYTSGEYEYYNNQSVTNPAWWRISSQTCAGGTDRFTTPTSASYNSTTLNIGGKDYTCFKTGYNLYHSSMTSNVGNDVVVITAYREDDTTKVGTATKSISNILEPTHYTTYLCITVGNSSESYGTPSTVMIGDGLTAAGGSASITGGTCQDTFKYYQKYTSGTQKSGITTETVDSTITWSLSTSTFTTDGGTVSSTDRFTLSGMTVNHTTMGTNVGTDRVAVTVTNANSTSKYTTSSIKSIENSLDSTHYRDSGCTTTGENISTYGTPTASIGDGLLASGGSATVTCTVNNTGGWYQKYTSGSVATYNNQSISGTAGWRITVNGNSRFTASGSSYTLSGVGTVYANGASVNHTTMGSYVGTDSVTVTAYNTGSSTNTATSTKSVSNALTSIAITLGSNTIDYNGTTSMTVKASYTSGLSTHDVTSEAYISTSPSNIITITI